MVDIRCTAVVPTVGASPFLRACLEALRDDAAGRLEIVVVDQARHPIEGLEGLADRVLRSKARGFTVANNHAWRETRTPYVATINDDALIDPGWLGALLGALDDSPHAAAAQGVIRGLDDPAYIDGRGLAWNDRWQAIQLDHGQCAPSTSATAPTEVFGVSATAAVYRRSALEAISHTPPGQPLAAVFDERLGSYYEDVDLACRLRAAGWRALSVPAATARHAGGASSDRHRFGARPSVYTNRHLVLAKILGRAYWPRLPAIVSRDLRDLARAITRAEGHTAVGIVAGLARALPRLPRFAHLGPPLLPPSALKPAVSAP